MKLVIRYALLLLLMAVPALSQQKPPMPGLSTFTLTSPYAADGHGRLKRSDKVDRNCFDFVSESEVPCRKRWDIVYGNMRAGEEWDWFFVPADRNGSRTRMVSLGKKQWADVRSLPEVKALPKLKPGEKRVARVDASGTDGADGSPGHSGTAGANGMNGDGTSSPAISDTERGPFEIKPAPVNKGVSTNEHFIKAEKGRMYVLRVVDDEHDFYVLIRVDDIVRGRTATISWLKLVDL